MNVDSWRTAGQPRLKVVIWWPCAVCRGKLIWQRAARGHRHTRLSAVSHQDRHRPPGGDEPLISTLCWTIKQLELFLICREFFYCKLQNKTRFDQRSYKAKWLTNFWSSDMFCKLYYLLPKTETRRIFNLMMWLCEKTNSHSLRLVLRLIGTLNLTVWVNSGQIKSSHQLLALSHKMRGKKSVWSGTAERYIYRFPP